MKELKIVNRDQVYFYLLHGVNPVRIEPGNNGVIVFIYTKESTNKLFGEWVKLSDQKRKAKAEFRKSFEAK